MSSAVTGTRLPVLRRPPPLASLAPFIALFLPLLIYNIGFRYLGSGDTAPAELLPIAILRGHGFDFREFVSGDLPYWFRALRGRVVSNYPVLPGILNLPVYAAARLAGVDLYTHRFFLSMLTASTIAALSVLCVPQGEGGPFLRAGLRLRHDRLERGLPRPLPARASRCSPLDRPVGAPAGRRVDPLGRPHARARGDQPADQHRHRPAAGPLCPALQRFLTFATMAVPPVVFHMWYANARVRD